MRVLVAIPHYFRPPGGPARPGGHRDGQHGSETGSPAGRAAQVARCVSALHGCFGERQALAGGTGHTANAGLAGQVDVALVTTGTDHLVDRLPRHLFTHCVADTPPRHLGFACHELLRRNAGRYDWFAYLEDDIEVADPLFLPKLAWFGRLFGDDTLLQPNRFELSAGAASAATLPAKLYIDGPTTRPEVSARLQDRSAAPRLEADTFGRRFVFERVENPHSGCFFLRDGQLGQVAAAPAFGRPTAAFFGPLESAATLPLMQAFRVYKPARENAGFLEVQHLARHMLPAAENTP